MHLKKVWFIALRHTHKYFLHFPSHFLCMFQQVVFFFPRRICFALSSPPNEAHTHFLLRSYLHIPSLSELNKASLMASVRIMVNQELQSSAVITVILIAVSPPHSLVYFSIILFHHQ